MIDPRLIQGLGFQGGNATWESVLSVLEEAIAEETAVAISRETTGEDRIHAAGRAEALRGFKSDLLLLRDQALIAQGVMLTPIDR
jgi:hypothetical protein